VEKSLVSTFRIVFPKNLFEKYKTPKSLINYFMKTQFMLTPKKKIDAKYFSKDFKYKKPFANWRYISEFLMNRIPSDKHLAKNKKFKILEDEKSGKLLLADE